MGRTRWWVGLVAGASLACVGPRAPAPASPACPARAAGDSVPLLVRLATASDPLLVPLPSREGRVGPQYPRELRERGVTGRVVLDLVVDTSGRVDLCRSRVVQATQPAFLESVRTYLRGVRFEPPRLDGRPVRVLATGFFVEFDASGGSPLGWQ